MRAARLRRAEQLRGTHSYGWVLLAVSVSFFLQAAGGEGNWVRLAAALAQAVALVLAFWTAGVRRELKRAVVVLVALSCIAALAIVASGGAHSEGLSAVLGAAFVLAASAAIVSGFGSQTVVDTRTISGALAVYLLIGLFFADLYAALGAFSSEPFFAGGASETRAHFVYFGYITQTTVGYGDLTAATNAGRTLAIVQALLGQLYLVTVVSLVIGNLGRQRQPRASDEVEQAS